MDINNVKFLKMQLPLIVLSHRYVLYILYEHILKGFIKQISGAI
jgi:hypothetical protein